MPIDSSIAMGVKPLQLESPLNMMSQVMQVQGAQNQNAMAQYGLSKAKRMDDQQNALMSALQGGGIDLSTPEGQMKAISIAPDVAAPIIKASTEAQLARSTIGKNDAESGKFGAQATEIAVKGYRDNLAGITDRDSAAKWVASQYADPRTSRIMQSLGPQNDAIARIPDPAQDPAAFNSWKQQNALGATRYIELNAPKTNVVNTGGKTLMTQTPGLGGAPTVAGTFANTQSPDSIATNATSRANNAATIAKDFTVAGIKPDGTPLAPLGPNGQEEDWIRNAATRLNMTGVLPTNLGRGAQGAQDIKRIQREAARQAADSGMTPEQLAIQQVTAKRALTSFAPGGKDGAAVESANTALNHLDTLRQLAEAQGNGNIPLFNQIANRFAAETGQPAPTNLQGAVTMVGPEISKAVIGAGGTGGDREKTDAALAALVKGSPAQAEGQIATMQDLFGGRLMEKQRSYERGTGMKDFATGGFLSPAAQRVLAARTATAPAAQSQTMPPDIAAILQKHGGK